MNQSSNFEVSCQSIMWISWSLVVVRFDSLCVAHSVSMYACMVLCTGCFTGLGLVGGIMVRCCSLSVNSDKFLVGVGLRVLVITLVNCFLSCWNSCSKSAKGWWVSVSSQHSSDESLSSSSIGWSCVVRCKEVESWVSGMSLCVLVSISSHHAMCLFGTFQRCLAEPSGLIVCSLGTCVCWWCAGDRRQVTYQAITMMDMVLFCAGEGLCKSF